MFPDLHEKSVLDLGCGYGWHCKYALDHGAIQILGIDLSDKMIGEAQKRNPDPKITYQVCALEDYEYPAGVYDCVISNLVLHYLSDIDSVFQKVYATLKMNGVFLLNIEHPVFTAGVNQDWMYDGNGKAMYWPIDNYFYPGARLTNFLGQKVIKQHHTLTQILMGLRHAGFILDIVEEAVPSAEMKDNPEMADEWRRPMMLLIRALKETVTLTVKR